MDALLQGVIDEHRRDNNKNTMIDHLLSLQQSQPEYYTDQIIKGLMIVPTFNPFSLSQFQTGLVKSNQLKSF